MKERISKSLISALLLLGWVVSAAAAASQDPRPPANDYFPDKWEEYPKAGPFRIRFPEPPREGVSNQGGLEIHYLEYAGLLQYRLSYVQYKVTIEDPDRVKDILNGLKSIAAKNSQDGNSRLVAEREVQVNGHPGLFVQVDVNGKETVRLQWLIVGPRLYTISTVAQKGSSEELASKNDFEKVALAFLNSFHLVSQ